MTRNRTRHAVENDFQYAAGMFGRPALLILALSLGVAGCGEAQGDAGAEAVGVVSTTTQVADMARNVGGNRVEVSSLLPPGADPHDYEVRPRDIEALAGAEAVLRSGGELDEWLEEAIEGSGTEAPTVDLSERLPAGTDPDPHWWHDPRNAQRAVAAIRDALIAADPDGRATYQRNAAAYLAELEALDTAVQRCLRQVPAEQRKLVTTHDSLAHYAARYDIEAVGTVIPSSSTAGQPSAGDTRDLVETIEREDVRAIFTESSVNPRVERAIAEETGATIGAPLWADTLGPEGSTGATYLGSIAANTRALVDGFTGGAVDCRLPA